MSLNEDSYREHVEQEMDEVWSPVKRQAFIEHWERNGIS